MPDVSINSGLTSSIGWSTYSHSSEPGAGPGGSCGSGSGSGSGGGVLLLLPDLLRLPGDFGDAPKNGNKYLAIIYL